MNFLAGKLADYLLNEGDFSKLEPFETTYPVTREPQTHPILVHAEGWTEDVVGITLGKKNKRYATSKSIKFIQKLLKYRHPEKIRIPKNALSVSLIARNFDIGTSCQEFIPEDYKMPAGSYFSYQMLSNNLQATFYNEGGRAYLAGICYYLTPKGQKETCFRAEQFMVEDVLLQSTQFPPVDRKSSSNFEKFKIYGRDCKTAGKRVAVHVKTGEAARHTMYNYRAKYRVTESCAECAAEYRHYNYVNVNFDIDDVLPPLKSTEEPAKAVEKDPGN